MSVPLDKGVAGTEPSLGGRIDQVCDRFEAEWRAKKSPRIEDYLRETSAEQVPRLLRELLQMEVELRQADGETPVAEEYRSRFPDQTEAIDAVFAHGAIGKRLGDYELLEELGRGGMGVVYRARQVHLDQPAAVKVLPGHYVFDRQAVSRFKREMKLIGRLDHANIVRAYYAGEDQGALYLAMEYVDGVTLQELVAATGPLPVGAACEIVRQAALGLQHAHVNGLVHRDLKPANLMLNRAGVVKVLDLGLGRLQASPASQALTLSGAAMGTVDYMAPEQWENSSGVDIRADLYSLGCTLYFLLTGQPPYGEPAYDSNRKKLMAHAVAPVPSVLEARPDCPEEFDEILHFLMAKDPGERFAVPEDVVDAMVAFSRPAELLTLAATVVRASPAAKSDAVLARAATDTMTPTPSPSPSPSPQRKVYSRIARRRRLRRRVLWGLTLGCSLLIAAAGWWFRPASGRLPAAPRAVPRIHPTIDLAVLPGLHGQWWFDEMPWMAPFVRVALAEKAAAMEAAGDAFAENPVGYINPNVREAQEWLLAAVRNCRDRLGPMEKQLLDELLAVSADDLNDSELRHRLAEGLQHFASEPAEEADGPGLYTRALLQHKLAALGNDLEEARRAAASYTVAAERLLEQKGAASSLWLLCMADSARLWAQVLGDYSEARRRFEQAVSPRTGSLLFRAETLVAYGGAATAAGNYEDGYSHFTRASRILEGAEQLSRSHPLMAHVCERFAWSLMDQWRVEDASQQFETAYNIRWANRRESKSALASIYVFHNQHGEAMRLRYRGDLAQARRQYENLVGDIREALKEAQRQKGQPGQQRYLRDLRERLSNSLERWGDCALYQGAAADPAGVNLTQACGHYQEARQMADEAGAAAVMGCKRVIALAFLGEVAKAREEFAEAAISRQAILGEDRERVTLLRQLAGAVLEVRGSEGGSGQAALRKFLDQFELNPDYADRHRREIQELQLLGAEVLVLADLSRSDRQAAAKDAEYLEKLMNGFPARAQMLPYLRRYYELAIEAMGNTDLKRTASYILATRVREGPAPLRPPETALLVFYFGPKENFALFLPPEGDPVRIGLSISRAKIKEAVARGKRLPVEPEVLSLVEQQRRSGNPLEISWSDTMCWPREEEGLGPKDWPFADLALPTTPGTP